MVVLVVEKAVGTEGEKVVEARVEVKAEVAMAGG